MKFDLALITECVALQAEELNFTLENVEHSYNEQEDTFTYSVRVGLGHLFMEAKQQDDKMTVKGKLVHLPDETLFLPEFVVFKWENFYEADELEHTTGILSDEITDALTGIRDINDNNFIWGYGTKELTNSQLNICQSFMSEMGYSLISFFRRYKHVEKTKGFYVIFDDDILRLRYQGANGKVLRADKLFATKDDIRKIVTDFVEGTDIDIVGLFNYYIDPNDIGIDITNSTEGELRCLSVSDGLKTTKAKLVYFQNASISVECETTLESKNENGKYEVYAEGRNQSLLDEDTKLIRALKLLNILQRFSIDGFFFYEQGLEANYNTLYKALEKVAEETKTDKKKAEVEEVYLNWPRNAIRSYRVDLGQQEYIVTTPKGKYYEIELRTCSCWENPLVYHTTAVDETLDDTLSFVSRFLNQRLVTEFLQEEKIRLVLNGWPFRVFLPNRNDPDKFEIAIDVSQHRLEVRVGLLAINPVSYSFTTNYKPNQTFLDALRSIVEDRCVKTFINGIKELEDELTTINRRDIETPF